MKSWIDTDVPSDLHNSSLVIDDWTRSTVVHQVPSDKRSCRASRARFFLLFRSDLDEHRSLYSAKEIFLGYLCPVVFSWSWLIKHDGNSLQSSCIFILVNEIKHQLKGNLRDNCHLHIEMSCKRLSTSSLLRCSFIEHGERERDHSNTIILMSVKK